MKLMIGGIDPVRQSTCTFDGTILWQKHHKIVENLKIVQSHEIRNIHATFLECLHNFVTLDLESQFCGIKVTIFCHFTIFCCFYQNFVTSIKLCIVTKLIQQMCRCQIRHCYDRSLEMVKPPRIKRVMTMLRLKIQVHDNDKQQFSRGLGQRLHGMEISPSGMRSLTPNPLSRWGPVAPGRPQLRQQTTEEVERARNIHLRERHFRTEQGYVRNLLHNPSTPPQLEWIVPGRNWCRRLWKDHQAITPREGEAAEGVVWQDADLQGEKVKVHQTQLWKTQEMVQITKDLRKIGNPLFKFMWTHPINNDKRLFHLRKFLWETLDLSKVFARRATCGGINIYGAAFDYNTVFYSFYELSGPVKIWSRAAFGLRAGLWTCLP